MKKEVRILKNQKGFGSIGLLVIVSLMIAAGGGAAVVTSEKSSPGDPLYSVKEAVNKAKVSTAMGAEARISAHLDIADEKLEAMSRVSLEGEDNIDKLALLEEEIARHEVKAAEELRKAGEEEKSVNDKVVARLQANLTRHQIVLTRVLESAPEPARAALRKALQNAQEKGLDSAIEQHLEAEVKVN